MRLFAALPVAEPAHAEVVRVLADLRETGWPVRWVHDDGLHLTLKFFGRVAAEQLTPIAAALRAAATDLAPLPLRVSELGAFPTPRRARVVWVGVEGPPALELLQDRIERHAAAIGFPVEGRPFRPHVTVGRVRNGERLPAGALAQFDGRLEPTVFVGDRIVLYESRAGAGGARYEPRFSLDLGR